MTEGCKKKKVMVTHQKWSVIGLIPNYVRFSGQTHERLSSMKGRKREEKTT